MTKWCSLLQLMVPLVVWLCEETERAVRKYHKSISSTLASTFKTKKFQGKKEQATQLQTRKK